MKNILTAFLALSLLLSSCADEKELGGKVYEPYGWADVQDVKSDKVVYKANTGNIIWSIILFETVGAPIYLTGWQIMEPVRLKSDTVSSK